MPNQTIPITLQWGPVTADISALDINQLGTLFAAQLSGNIRADISFVLPVLFDPTAFVTQLIFNIPQNVFKSWNQNQGRYVPVSQYATGDTKYQFGGVDSVATGWVLVDGRAISAIPGLSFAQKTVLETLFGVGGSLPTVPEVVPTPSTPAMPLLVFVGFA